MSKIIILVLPLLSFVVAGPAWSADDVAKACYQKEIDHSTRRIYKNQAQYDADLAELRSEEPKDPGMYRLYKAYQVYKEAIQGKKFRNDKVAHCYGGCRIAAAVDKETAIYVAWYKEEKDLTDCVRSTHFEWEDITATVKALDAALEAETTEEQHAVCQKACRR